MARDPIVQFEQKLTIEKLATSEELEMIRTKARTRIEKAVRFAQERPYPSVDLLTRFVWA